MSILVRRSNLLVPLGDASAVANAWKHNADAVTLDLTGNGSARDAIKAAIPTVAKGGAEVFVRVNKTSVQADLEASVWPDLCGIMLPCVESAAEVTQAAEIVALLEKQRGIAAGSLQFILMLESARGVWDIRAIVKASPRVTQVALDERALATDLGITPLPELDPFEYARGRLAVEATAAKVAAVGMAYPLSVQPCELPEAELHELATKAKNLGMKGVICPHPYSSWVAPVNAAFTPTPALVEWNRRVREAFAVGVAAGTAAVPLDGKMIDVPVDEWAIVVLAMAEACAARDAQKRVAGAT
ncbi:MAG: aldolase/citrate lyase family protein [Burkholderiales bacterium]